MAKDLDVLKQEPLDDPLNLGYEQFVSASSFYSNRGDIKSRLVQDYSNSGDIQTISGQDYERKGDIWATILKRKAQQHVSFEYDVETELT
jgi:hypothetical protein